MRQNLTALGLGLSLFASCLAGTGTAEPRRSPIGGTEVARPELRAARPVSPQPSEEHALSPKLWLAQHLLGPGGGSTLGLTPSDPAPLAYLRSTRQSQRKEPRGLGAVGRLDFGPRAFCTGALIAPDLVATAAHCLFDLSHQAFAVSEIRFSAGLRGEKALATRLVKAAVAHPKYLPDVAPEVRAIRDNAFDLALLLLDQPIEDPRILPFDLAGQPLPGERVSVVSYAYNRPGVPTLEDSCLVIERQEGALVLTCDVDFGASGAPVFVRREGRPLLVSVIAAKAEADGRKVALGTRLDTPLAELMRMIDAQR